MQPVAPPDVTACPICHAESPPYTEKTAYGSTWRIRKCGGCGFGFVANRPTLDRLKEIYATDAHLAWDPPTPESHARRRDAARLVGQVRKLAPARGRSLDVGCGDGAFSFHLARRGFRPTMIDLDPRAEAAAAVVPGSAFRRCALEELDDPGPYDAVVMSQVLEHALDPLDWLRRAAGLLAPGGVLAVAVPNFAGVYRLLGRRDPFLIPPVHLNYFGPASMRRAFAAAGLAVARMASSSRVALGHRPSRRTRLARGAWNRLSAVLDFTPRGIILETFGVKEGDSPWRRGERRADSERR